MNPSRRCNASARCTHRSIALFPEDVETIKRYVNLLRDKKRTDDARRLLEAGLRINPRSTRLQELAEEMN
jgi:hypothetical protein